MSRIKIAENVYLDGSFWDCDCDKGFVHRRAELQCVRCSVIQDDAPDSRSNEIDYSAFYGFTEKEAMTDLHERHEDYCSNSHSSLTFEEWINMEEGAMSGISSDDPCLSVFLAIRNTPSNN